MKKLLIVPILAIGLVASALATPAPKVFVCKYVGTPGVDERLQTGQNPIDVSENAIKDFQGVGSYFNDAQGRSYVLAIDTGQDVDVSQCPQVQTSPPTDTPPITTNNNQESTSSNTNEVNNNTETPSIVPGFRGK